jgi:hypothetical protein
MKKKLSDEFLIIPHKKLISTRAWKLTSEYVRRKALVNPEEKDKKKWICRCYTCGGLFPYEKTVAGHFREKLGGNSLYFCLDNLRAQCQWNCNRMKHGHKEEYARKLVNELGADILEKLFVEGQKVKQWTKQELSEIAEEMENKYYS